MAGRTTPAAGRRTQAERRAETTRGLLDASLECLLHDGYAGLSTRRVAARAGVSPATLRFYFPNRAQFITAAVERMAIGLRREIAAQSLGDRPPVERFRAALDALWDICNGPLFRVIAELSVAARGDEDARDALVTAEGAVTRQLVESAAELFPDDIESPRFGLIVDLAVSSMRGLAIFQPVIGRPQLDRRREAIRDEVTEMYRQLVARREAVGSK